MRPLAAVGFVREVGEQTWEPTAVTHAMATDEIAAGHRMMQVPNLVNQFLMNYNVNYLVK
jgi:hypothetical protein